MACGVTKLALVYFLTCIIVGDTVLNASRSIGDENQPMHAVDVSLSPSYNIWNLVKRGGIDCGVKDHVNVASFSHYVSEVLPQLV